MRSLPPFAPLTLCLLLQAQALHAAEPPPSPTAAPEQTLTAESVLLRAVERRAVEAVNWGISAVNFERMLQAARQLAGATANPVIYWSQPLTGNNQTLTPNPDVIYLMPFFDTRNGPLVLEIPPASGGMLIGTLTSAWQAALEDVGPAGADQGKGGKYLILPPGFQGQVPDGYITVRSETYQGFALLRSVLTHHDRTGIDAAVAYGKRLRLYPLAQADEPSQTAFVDAAAVTFDATIPYDLRFFESLDRIVQAEPWLAKDKAMIDVLRTLGIEKGRPFTPNADQRAALESGAREARAWLVARFEDAFQPYYEGRQWAYPAPRELAETMAIAFEKPNGYTVDARGLFYSYAFSSTKNRGKGLFYLMTIRDEDGQPLDGGRSYRLTVPAGVPVRQYWSATVYDRATHALVRGTQQPGRSSLSQGLKHNADGSVTLLFSAQPPADRQANWIATNPDGRFEVLLRFFGPEEALRDKSWQMPDIEAERLGN
ncbi:hypothetical protein FQZ97_567100 [compost metagenome]